MSKNWAWLKHSGAQKSGGGEGSSAAMGGRGSCSHRERKVNHYQWIPRTFNDFKNFQWLSRTFNDIQGHLTSFNEFQGLSMAFKNFQWLSRTFNDFQWHWMTFNEFQGLSVTFTDFQWSSLGAEDERLLRVVCAIFPQNAFHKSKMSVISGRRGGKQRRWSKPCLSWPGRWTTISEQS